MRARLEALIDEMLDGQIMLDEALAEFEKLYIQKALARHKEHLSRTANVLGIHRNTLEYRVARIAQLAEIDLENADNRLALELGIRLLELDARTGGEGRRVQEMA